MTFIYFMEGALKDWLKAEVLAKGWALFQSFPNPSEKYPSIVYVQIEFEQLVFFCENSFNCDMIVHMIVGLLPLT